MCHKSGYADLLLLAVGAKGMNLAAIVYCVSFVFILNYFIYGLLISVLFEEFSRIKLVDEVEELKILSKNLVEEE